MFGAAPAGEVWERTTREERAELVVQLAARLGLHHGLTVAGLAAGDRAQTVPLLGKVWAGGALFYRWHTPPVAVTRFPSPRWAEPLPGGGEGGVLWRQGWKPLLGKLT